MKTYRIEAKDGCGVFRSGLVEEMCLFTSYFYIPEGGDDNSAVFSEDKWGYVDWDIKAPTPVRPFKDENGLEYEAIIPKTYLRKYHHFGHPTLESIKTWWDKTKRHIITLLNLGYKPNMEAYEALKKYWESVHGDKSFLSLNKSKEQFFDDNVVYKYDHDYLHSLVAYPNNPVYTKCLKDNEDVLIDYNKFIELSYEEQLQMFREEIVVIAIERWLVNEANKGLYSWYEAYKLALKKTITNLTKNWANTFVIMNIRELSTPKWDLFNNALNVLGENMSKVDMKVFKDILEECEEQGYNTCLQELIYGLCEGDIKTDVLSTVKSYTHLQQEGGGEGGSEYCYGVFELNGVIYKAEYSYYSYHGHDYDDIVSTLSVVNPVQKTITVYE